MTTTRFRGGYKPDMNKFKKTRTGKGGKKSGGGGPTSNIVDIQTKKPITPRVVKRRMRNSDRFLKKYKEEIIAPLGHVLQEQLILFSYLTPNGDISYSLTFTDLDDQPLGNEQMLMFYSLLKNFVDSYVWNGVPEVHAEEEDDEEDDDE